MKTTLLFIWNVCLGKILIYRKKIFCCVQLILFNLNFTFILTLNLNRFFIPLAEDVQKHCYYIQSIYYSTKARCTFKWLDIFMSHKRFLNSFCRQLGVFRSVCVCVSVCACVSIVFLMLFRQLPYLKFRAKFFATNCSQIWVFSEDFKILNF